MVKEIPVDPEIESADDDQELYEHYRFVADKGQALLRVDKFLLNRIENATRSKIQQGAEAGNVLVNGKVVKSNYRVKPNDVITVVFAHPPREIELIPQNIPINIVYEDADLLIVNKEAGMVVHPGYGNYKGTLVNALVYHFQNLPVGKNSATQYNEKGKDDKGKKKNKKKKETDVSVNLDSREVASDSLHLPPRPGLVHRIDKNTSGLLVIAKTDLAMVKLAQLFFDHDIERTYVALVWGDFEENEGTITGHIGRSLKDRKVMAVFPDGDFGKEAITHYKVIERFGYVSLIECRLETGRTHQIRAHMQYIGHPLFNDETYGGNRILKGTTFAKYRQFVENCFEMMPRHALHAKSLGFKHPTTKKMMQFTSELPADMASVIEKWRNYAKNSM